MPIKDYLQNNQIIIVPREMRKKVLKEISRSNTCYSYKLLSIEEFRKQFLFDYDEDALAYLMDTYHLKLDISKMYLNKMYDIEELEYQEERLKMLASLKKDLEKKNLLKKDPLFLSYLKRQNVLVYGFDILCKKDQKLLEKVKEFTTCEIVWLDDPVPKEIPYFKADTIEEEVEAVLLEIIKQNHQGTSFDKMYLVGVTEEYRTVLKRLFSFYHVPLSLESKTSILGLEGIKRFLIKVKSGLSIDEAYREELSESKVTPQVLPVLNRLHLKPYKPEILYEILVDSLKKIMINEKKVHPSITEKSLFSSFDEEDYVFVLGMNQNIIPKLYKDEDYLNDNCAKELGIDTTKDKNKQERETTKRTLLRIPNVFLFSKEKSSFEEYYPSSLLKELPLSIKEIKEELTYSNQYNKIKLTKKLDHLLKYGTKEENVDILLTHYHDIPYLSYHNEFSGININKENKPLNLSYSKMDTYYHCAFAYYLKYIMKVDRYEESFPQFIGNLYHKLLSLCMKKSFDFDKEWQDFLKTRDLSKKEHILLANLKEDLQFVVQTVKKQYELSNFRKVLCEQNFTIDLQEEGVHFTGIVDKILYQEEQDQTNLAIVDYKTGTITSDFTYVSHGLGLQLPVYLYLIKKSNQFHNPFIAGLYFQRILHPKLSYDPKKEYREERENRLKLMGYSTSNERILEQFDVTYQNSEVIKSMRLSKNGFYRYAKLLKEDQVETLAEVVEEKIKEAAASIKQGNFPINPKQIGKDNIGCKNCHYQDICYRKPKDIVYMEPKEEGEQNANMDERTEASD